MPVSSKKGSIHYTDIGTDALNLLGIPEREGIVVSMGDEYSVLADRIQVVGSHLNCR